MTRWPQSFLQALRSGWISWRIKPVRIGWYEIRYGRDSDRQPEVDGLRFWSGRAWLFGPGEGHCLLGHHPDDAWRGMVSEAGR